jgi:hypothetical protein
MIWEYFEAYNLGEITADELTAVLCALINVEGESDECHIAVN